MCISIGRSVLLLAYQVKKNVTVSTKFVSPPSGERWQSAAPGRPFAAPLWSSRKLQFLTVTFLLPVVKSDINLPILLMNLQNAAPQGCRPPLAGLAGLVVTPVPPPPVKASLMSRHWLKAHLWCIIKKAVIDNHCYSETRFDVNKVSVLKLKYKINIKLITATYDYSLQSKNESGALFESPIVVDLRPLQSSLHSPFKYYRISMIPVIPLAPSDMKDGLHRVFFVRT